MEGKTCKQDAADRLAAAAALARAGDYKLALVGLEKVLELDPEQAEAYFLRGFCHYMSGHYRHAVRDMDAATLLGCHTSQMWSRFESGQADDQEDANGN
jgi:Tfp pilus assembly protein PilF